MYTDCYFSKTHDEITHLFCRLQISQNLPAYMAIKCFNKINSILRECESSRDLSISVRIFFEKMTDIQ